MHEYSIVEQMLRRVQEEATARSAVAVHRISLRVGELAGVEPELLRSAFEIARGGTVCERAQLDVVTHRIRWTCPSCQREFARGEVLRCATCDRAARLDERSEELVVETIDMEVP